MNRPVHAACALAAALLLVIIASSVAALDGSDWGVTVDSVSTLRRSRELDDSEWGQRLRTALWGELFWELSGGGRATVTAEGSYVYTDERDYLFDVDRLRYSGLYPGLVTWHSVLAVDAGRFGFRDPTGLVLNHSADGVRASLRFPVVEVELGGAYTGLLLNPSSRIRVTDADRAEEDDDDEFYGPERLLGQLTVRLPDLPGRQSLSAGVLAQWDLRDDETVVTLNSQYFSLQGAGALLPNFYHTTFITIATVQTEIGSDSDRGAGLLFGTRLRYLREDWQASRLGASFTYASGPGSNIDPFVTISDPPTGVVFQPRLSNLMIAGLSYAVRPWYGSRSVSAGNLEFASAMRVYLRAVDDQQLVSGGLLAPLALEDGRRYAGSELEWTLRARPLPDLGAALTTGIFLPGVGAGDADPEFLARFELSLSL